MRFSLGTLLWMILLVAVTVSLGISIASLGPDLKPVPAFVGPRTTTGEEGQKSNGSMTVGGYTFDYASRWKKRSVGAVTEVSSPDRRIVVSVGPAPHGSLERATRVFVGHLHKQYERVHITRAVRGSIGGRRALVTRGSLRSKQGSDIRLLAIAMSRSGRQYLIAGFSNASIERGRLRIEVERIVGSLSLLRPS
jgi:hypothetical protein